MKGSRPSSQAYTALIGAFSLFSLIGGYFAATQPIGAGWRAPFSYHPFLMILGFVGLMGSGAVTKKMGGYSNTKMHGYLASAGLVAAFGGLFAIYSNKELLGKPHFLSNHSWGGIMALAGCVVVNVFGGLALHPDFGIAKTNKTFRTMHKWFGRICVLIGWIACLAGLQQLTEDKAKLAMFGLPLLVLFPFTII